jgi:hypothetical protein
MILFKKMIFFNKKLKLQFFSLLSSTIILFKKWIHFNFEIVIFFLPSSTIMLFKKWIHFNFEIVIFFLPSSTIILFKKWIHFKFWNCNFFPHHLVWYCSKNEFFFLIWKLWFFSLSPMIPIGQKMNSFFNFEIKIVICVVKYYSGCKTMIIMMIFFKISNFIFFTKFHFTILGII